MILLIFLISFVYCVSIFSKEHEHINRSIRYTYYAISVSYYTPDGCDVISASLHNNPFERVCVRYPLLISRMSECLGGPLARSRFITQHSTTGNTNFAPTSIHYLL